MIATADPGALRVPPSISESARKSRPRIEITAPRPSRTDSGRPLIRAEPSASSPIPPAPTVWTSASGASASAAT